MTSDRPTLMTFPCEYRFKIIGKNHIDFEAFAVGAVRQHFPKMSEAAVTSKESSNGQYISLTIVVQADSQEAIDNAYRMLTASELVLVAL